MHHLGLCTLPMLHCWLFLAYTPNWTVALFLLLLFFFFSYACHLP